MLQPYYRSTLELILKMMGVIGMHPFKKMSIPLIVFNLVSILIIIVLVFMQFTRNEITTKLLADSLESLFTSCHMIIKFLTVLLKNKDIKVLICKVGNSWGLDQFDEKFKEQCLREFKQIDFLIKSFIWSCIASMVFFIFCPFIADRLALICYVPEFIPRSLFIIFNTAIFCNFSACVIAIDSFSSLMIMFLCWQFKLLNERIAAIRFERATTKIGELECLEEMRTVIDYHNFLYEFLERLNSLIGVTVFLHYIIYTISMCFELFLLSKGSKNFGEVFKSLIYVSMLSAQITICFCIPSTMLTTEASKTRNIIYGSKWYLCPFESVRKNIIIMMTRAQEETALSAGNMFLVNLETCTEAFKKTLSFYTCLKTITENN